MKRVIEMVLDKCKEKRVEFVLVVGNNSNDIVKIVREYLTREGLRCVALETFSDGAIPYADVITKGNILTDETEYMEYDLVIGSPERGMEKQYIERSTSLLSEDGQIYFLMPDNEKIVATGCTIQKNIHNAYMRGDVIYSWYKISKQP